MFKTNLDLANVEHSPYTYNDLAGRLPLGLLELRDVRARPVPLRGHELPDLALEHPARRRGGRRHHARSSPCPPATRSPGSRADGARAPASAIFLVYLIPPTLLFLPLSRLITQLDLKDSLWALILVYPSFTIPFATWLLMGFFKTIPQELEDAALIDGASRLKALFLIILPDLAAGDPDRRHLRLLACA